MNLFKCTKEEAVDITVRFLSNVANNNVQMLASVTEAHAQYIETKDTTSLIQGLHATRSLINKLIVKLKDITDMGEFMYILDYSNCAIWEIELTEDDQNLETEELLDKYDVKMDNCSWLFSQQKLSIIQLEPK